MRSMEASPAGCYLRIIRESPASGAMGHRVAWNGSLDRSTFAVNKAIEENEWDRAARSLIGWPFSLIVGQVIAAMLITWLPHYLLWPWWPDLDAWATIAQGWDSGIRPYRDVSIINFPGQIEIAYVLGKLFGWGRTAPVYALDALLLIGFGTLLWFWSRRRFGRALPGLIASAAVLAVYANLDYTLVAQRDWQGPLLAIGALLTIQFGRGWPSLIVAAAFLAVGFTIRPHVVLFFPAVGLAILLRPAETWKTSVVRGVGWGLAFAVFVFLAFAPLIVQGLLADMIRGVRKASYGSGYNETTLRSISQGVWKEFGVDHLRRLIPGVGPRPLWDEICLRLEGWKRLVILGSLVTIVWRSDPASRRTYWPWMVAIVFAIFYEPLHPKRHLYLFLPLKLVAACCLAILADSVVRSKTLKPIVAAILLFLILAMAVPGAPAYCSVNATIQAFEQWKRADEPSQVPIGAKNSFRAVGPGFDGDDRSPYTWDDYRRTLAYLRRNTTAKTVVANALRGTPFPAMNGPVGRISPFPAESGVIWIWSVDTSAEAAFVVNLQKMPSGSVVVWSPEEKAF